MPRSILLFLSVLALSCVLGCVATVPYTAVHAQKQNEFAGEFVVISFLNRELATRTLSEWKTQGIQYEIRSYDTEIETGVFLLWTPEHPY